MIKFEFNNVKLWNDLDSKRRSSGLSWGRLEARLGLGKTTLMGFKSHKTVSLTTAIHVLKYLGKDLNDYVLEVNDAYRSDS